MIHHGIKTLRYVFNIYIREYITYIRTFGEDKKLIFNVAYHSGETKMNTDHFGRGGTRQVDEDIDTLYEVCITISQFVH